MGTLPISTAGKPNLLFIMTDHQRADSLGMVQASTEVTPNLNRLAADSSVFSRAYTTCPLCVPARTSLATGIYPTRNGVVFNDWTGDTAGNHKTLHEYLSDAGYTVGHVGVHHIRVKPDLPQRVPFALWIDETQYANYLSEHGLDPFPVADRNSFRRQVTELQNGKNVPVEYSNTRVEKWDAPLEHFKDIYFAHQAADFLNGSPAQPFALFVNLWAPHPPLCLPEPYFSIFNPERIELPPNVGVTPFAEPASRRNAIAAQLADGVNLAQWCRVWAAHLGLLRLADDAIGMILQALAKRKDAGNTTIVFTSDHGDHLGQHCLYQKMEMYEPALNVPLILSTPGAVKGTFKTPVSHLDLLPTLLQTTGIPPEDELDGRSLLSAIRTGKEPEEQPVFSQYSGNPSLGAIRRSVVTGQWKYIYDPHDAAELYDLQADPLEMNNLARDPANAAILSRFHELSRQWGKDHRDWVFDDNA